jgi:hypothetical protein
MILLVVVVRGVSRKGFDLGSKCRKRCQRKKSISVKWVLVGERKQMIEAKFQ